MTIDTLATPVQLEMFLDPLYIKDGARTPHFEHPVKDVPAIRLDSDSLNQILALAARIERMLDDQAFRMRLAEEKRIERLKKRYRPQYRRAA